MLFTKREQNQIFFLVKRLVEDALSDGECTYDTFLDEVQKVKGRITISTIEDYIRGLPSSLSLPYITYNICFMIEDVIKRQIPPSRTTDADLFYWHVAALVIYKKGDVC